MDKRHVLIVTGCTLLLMLQSELLLAAEFKGVTFGHLPVKVTASGRVLVGGIPTNAPSAYEAFRLDADNWTNTILTYSTPGPEQTHPPWSESTGASADGSTVVIQSYLDNHCVLNDCNTMEIYGYSWKGGTFTSLPWLSGHDQARPMDVTADGSMAVGWSYERAHTFTGPYNLYRNAVTWNTSTGAITDLGKWGSTDDSWAVATSADGSVIVGQSGLIRGMEDYDETWWRPVFWRSSVGWASLDTLYSGSYTPFFRREGNLVNEMSNDGKIAVGHLYDGTSHLFPVFWDLNQNSPNFRKPTILPLLSGDLYTSGKALAASKKIDGRGYVIGGGTGEDPCSQDICFGSRKTDAVLWETDSLTFPIKVETILLGLGLENAISGWHLESVTSISDDAKVITGTGIHPNGQRWSWYADLRNPQPNETRAKAQYIGQSPGNLFTGRVKVGGTTSDASPSITPVQFEEAKLRPTVWYSYSAPVDGYLSLDLEYSLPFGLLSVYRENETVPMAYTYSCSDQNSAGPCFIPDELKIDANTMYYISVSGMEVPQGEEPFDLYHQFTPLSDSCEESFYLPQTLPAEVMSSTNDAAAPASAPTCGTVAVTSPGVWFKVVGTGGMMTASLDGAADFDTKLSVYCAECGGTPACIGANDDINGQYNTASEVEWCSSAGTVYHLLVHGYESATGNFTLSVSSVPSTCFSFNCPVANSSCSGAIPIEEEGMTIMADNTNAGTVTSMTQCGEVNNDVWFDYTAKCDGQVVIDTCQAQGDLVDSVLAIYDSCGGAELKCNDNSSQGDCNGSRSAIFYDVDPGQKIAIMAAEYGNSPQTGSFPLRVQEIPDNVDIQEVILPDVVQGDEVSIQLPVSGGCPTASLGYFANTGSTVLPPGLFLSRNGLLSGTASVSGSYTFDVFVTDGEVALPNRSDSATYGLIVRPANDNCSSAQPVTEGLTLFGNAGATSQTQPSPQCSGESYSSDLWFKYTSACSGIATASTCGSSFDTTLALYEGSMCPVSGAADQCSTDEAICGPGSQQSELVFDVMKGQSYFLRVGSSDSTGSVQGNGKLLVTCFEDCNDNKSSDLVDITNGTSKDSNGNSVPDECEKLDKSFPWILFAPIISGATGK